ncbi:MAG: hypothetical protein Q4C47_08560, partial [Planctomycetia bacterium]|nr:hypothetical protein [Planctomycetia bacterium]
LVAMGWLVRTWVLPWILVGDPPGETERLAARLEVPVVWWEIQVCPLSDDDPAEPESGPSTPSTPSTGSTSPVVDFFRKL